MKLFRKNCLKNIIVLITSMLILGQGYSYPALDNSLNSIEYGTSNNLLTELLKWCGSDNGAIDEFPVSNDFPAEQESDSEEETKELEDDKISESLNDELQPTFFTSINTGIYAFSEITLSSLDINTPPPEI